MRLARQERRKADKALKQEPAPIVPTKSQSTHPAKQKALPVAQPKKQPAPPPVNPVLKQSKRLKDLLYLQHGRCFFCGEELPFEKANIEHLYAKSRIRMLANSDENVVACHESLNRTFAAMRLKDKIAFVLDEMRKNGKFKCP
jgi:hypothetical protein